MGWVLRFFSSTVGKKALMALSGLVGFGFVLGHMLGNLQVYLGPEAINHYAVTLHTTPLLLWGARTVLTLAIAVHIWAAVSLQNTKIAARPIRYQKPGNIQANPASKTMFYSGVLLLLFVVYHVLHLTWGSVHPEFKALDAYGNLVRGFQVWPIAVFYMVCMLFLGAHLGHGGYSLFWSLGLVHPKYIRTVRTATYVGMMAVVLGNISIPVCVLAGVLK